MKGAWKIWAALGGLLWLVCRGAAANPTNEARFADEIARFEVTDRKSPPPTDPVLFVGSSSIVLWTSLASDFPEQPVLNRGFGGALVSDVVQNFARVVTPYRPRQILFYAGDNDLAAGKSPAQIFLDWTNFVALVKRELGTTPIAFISIKPSPARFHLIEHQRELNRQIRRYCEADPQLKFIDVASAMLDQQGHPLPELFRPDRLHLNQTGYALWSRIIATEMGWTQSNSASLRPFRWLAGLMALALALAAYFRRKRGEPVPAG